MKALYKESEFFSIHTEIDWARGLHENISIDQGLEIVKANKYVVDKIIDTRDFDKINKIIDYAAKDHGVIYIVDEKNILWEYDSISGILEEFYEIENLKNILSFEIIENTLCGLFEEEDYYIRVYSLIRGNLLREIKIEKNKELEAVYVSADYHVWMLQEDLQLIGVDIHKNHIEKLDLRNHLEKKVKLEKDFAKKKKWILCSYEDEFLVIGNREKGWLIKIPLKEIKNKEIQDLMMNKIEIKNLKALGIDKKGVLYIHHEKNGRGYWYQVKKDEENLEPMHYLRELVEKIKFDRSGKIIIKNREGLICICKKKLRVHSKKGMKNYTGIYYTDVLDSQEGEKTWNKIQVHGSVPKDTQIRIFYYAFDGDEIIYNERVYKVREFLMKDDIKFEEKEAVFNKLWSKEIINPKEALFQNAKGRYILLRIELNGRELETPKIHKLRVYYHRSSYLKYLPEIYQSNIEEDDFLERYLLIFEAFYMEIEEKIDYIANYFDVDHSPPTFLRWLCQWVGLEIDQTWTTEKIRKLLKAMPYLYKKRGTKRAIEKILQIYLGVFPIIIENFQVQQEDLHPEIKRMMNRIYGENPYGYTVLVKLDRDLTDAQINTVNKILKNESPAYCEYNFVILKPLIFLDKHSYLGINSNVSDYSLLKLDGKSILPYNAILIDEEDQYFHNASRE